MSMIKNSFKHFKKICKHKYYVGKYCFHYGLYKQGITHDLSKFSPTEFFESVKYYQGDRSPIDACKEQNGYSNAWLHHKGRNKHHYEYFVDNLDNGGKPLLMPFKYMVEMFCDYIGAGQAYMGKNFTIESEYQWWQNKKQKPLAMHPVTLMFIDNAMGKMYDNNTLPSYVELVKCYEDAAFNYMSKPITKLRG